MENVPKKRCPTDEISHETQNATANPSTKATAMSMAVGMNGETALLFCCCKRHRMSSFEI
jgi:hypothetical protein